MKRKTKQNKIHRLPDSSPVRTIEHRKRSLLLFSSFIITINIELFTQKIIITFLCDRYIEFFYLSKFHKLPLTSLSVTLARINLRQKSVGANHWWLEEGRMTKNDDKCDRAKTIMGDD